MMAHAYNPSTWEVKAGLGYIDPVSKSQKIYTRRSLGDKFCLP
jgi:hypothetical protein